MAKSLPRKVKVGISFALGSQPFKPYFGVLFYGKRGGGAGALNSFIDFGIHKT